MRHAGTRLYAPQLAIFAYYLLRDLRDPVRQFLYSGGGSIPTDRSYFSGRAAGFEIACVGSIPYGRESANL